MSWLPFLLSDSTEKASAYSFRSKSTSIIGLPLALTPLILPMVVKAAANATRLWFSSKSEAAMGVTPIHGEGTKLCYRDPDF